jgi:hypothetical protein
MRRRAKCGKEKPEFGLVMVYDYCHQWSLYTYYTLLGGIPHGFVCFVVYLTTIFSYLDLIASNERIISKK